MFGRWLKSHSEIEPIGAEALENVVRRALGDADSDTVLVVTAMAGLLGAVAYADRDFSPEEEERIRRELARIRGIGEADIGAICAVLREHIIEVSTVQMPHYARVLLDLADHELRVEILAVMLEVAAADGEIAHVETNVLRMATNALGLTQLDYNVLQEKHVAKLAALKPAH
jgi:uncharacterized tellurite resistance protein B-like protein